MRSSLHRSSQSIKFSSLLALTGALITGTPRTASADQVFQRDAFAPATFPSSSAEIKFKQEGTSKGLDPRLVQGLFSYSEIQTADKETRKQWASELLKSAYEKKSQNTVMLKEGVPAYYARYLNACLGIPEGLQATSEGRFDSSVVTMNAIEAVYRDQGTLVCGSFNFMHDVGSFSEFNDYTDYAMAQARQSQRVMKGYMRFQPAIQTTKGLESFSTNTLREMTNVFTSAILVSSNTPITFKKNGPFETGEATGDGGAYVFEIGANTRMGDVTITIDDKGKNAGKDVRIRDNRDLILMERISPKK